ncbi:MAG: hypothetical protein KJ600_05785 [Nanoarchaeota archaeon]|nr:hypothetical protein [Nanoarchaeota archaeon]MBU1104040.1 hypothetical protein [Nanoarchaeota archaeon]
MEKKLTLLIFVLAIACTFALAASGFDSHIKKVPTQFSEEPSTTPASECGNNICEQTSGIATIFFQDREIVNGVEVYVTFIGPGMVGVSIWPGYYHTFSEAGESFVTEDNKQIYLNDFTYDYDDYHDSHATLTVYQGENYETCEEDCACVDTDDGEFPLVLGEILRQGQRHSSDSCYTGIHVAEWFCDEQGYGDFTLANCRDFGDDYFCDNGACVEFPLPRECGNNVCEQTSETKTMYFQETDFVNHVKIYVTYIGPGMVTTQTDGEWPHTFLNTGESFITENGAQVYLNDFTYDYDDYHDSHATLTVYQGENYESCGDCTCVDTDGGEFPITLGQILLSGTLSNEDDCYGPYTITEYSCSEGAMQSTMINCRDFGENYWCFYGYCREFLM